VTEESYENPLETAFHAVPAEEEAVLQRLRSEWHTNCYIKLVKIENMI